MTKVVLGSSSSARLRVLKQAGIDPLVVVSDVDEDALIASLDPELPPTEMVAVLADAKAIDVAARLPEDVASDCVVLGCDSMLYRDGKLCGKPGAVDVARQQWQSMAGGVGHLLTGHAVLRISQGAITHAETQTGRTTVHFGRPSEDDLVAYLQSGEPIHVAGAFTLDGLGGWFIERIEGDPSNVIGISLVLVNHILHSMGLSVTDLWRDNC